MSQKVHNIVKSGVCCCYCSVCKLVVSSQPHGLQHARLLCPPRSPGVCSNSCTLSWWFSLTIILCYPLLLLPSIFPSIRVFSNESALCIRWPKYCSFSFSISPSSEYSGLISFRIDWFDLLAVQWTLKSLQYHKLKATILWHSAFLLVQLSHLYRTAGKNHSFDYTEFCWQSDVSDF